MTIQSINEYCARRDAALLGDLDCFIAFAESQGNAFSTRLSAEITQHKMRTAVVTLPIELRRASWRWLTERGYQAWDVET
jgi:hypothetical protein